MRMKPKTNECELIVFGKGVGESILFRVTKDKWIVIDSFISNDTGKPVAIEYLESRNIDIEKIIGVICTHWDDDHIRGISNIIEMHTTPLPVVLPIVLKEDKVKEYAYFGSDNDIRKTTEFKKVLELKKEKRCTFCWAESDRNLFGKAISDSNIIFKALSPNDEQYEEFLKSLTLPKAGEKKIYSYSENSISVALFAKNHVDTFLFGGDLEISELGGWKDICDNYHESAKSHIFKIPHHGSKTAYYDGVWTDLVDNPIAIITRFNRSHLPKDDMIENIRKNSSKLYIVGPEPKNDRNIMLKKLKYAGMLKDALIIDNKYGYVRLHRDNNSVEWTAEIYGSVKELSVLK